MAFYWPALAFLGSSRACKGAILLTSAIQTGHFAQWGAGRHVHCSYKVRHTEYHDSFHLQGQDKMNRQKGRCGDTCPKWRFCGVYILPRNQSPDLTLSFGRCLLRWKIRYKRYWSPSVISLQGPRDPKIWRAPESTWAWITFDGSRDALFKRHFQLLQAITIIYWSPTVITDIMVLLQLIVTDYLAFVLVTIISTWKDRVTESVPWGRILLQWTRLGSGLSLGLLVHRIGLVWTN